METIYAKYPEMRSIADNVDGLSEQYGLFIKDVYKIIESLESDWKGQDNLNYTNKVKGYEADFMNLKKAIDNYVVFLNKSADAIQNAQESLANAANGGQG